MINYHVGLAIDTLVLIFKSFFEGTLELEVRSKLEKVVGESKYCVVGWLKFWVFLTLILLSFNLARLDQLSKKIWDPVVRWVRLLCLISCKLFWLSAKKLSIISGFVCKLLVLVAL